MRLALIGTFYGRHENTAPLLQRVLDSTRRPDEFYAMCEGLDDLEAVIVARNRLHLDRVSAVWWSTPRNEDGSYQVIPYSSKINWALDHTSADAICYLDNGSMPDPDKYRVMLEALEEHPEWGAVYCGQERTGYHPEVIPAHLPVDDAYGYLNYTQVMHRPTADRWPLDMALAQPLDMADAEFWRLLHESLGPFYPAGIGRVLDSHHMESQAAQL